MLFLTEIAGIITWPLQQQFSMFLVELLVLHRSTKRRDFQHKVVFLFIGYVNNSH